MRIGDLKERVEIQQPSTTADGQGGRSTTWATLATVWAAVQMMSAREAIEAAAIGAQQAYQLVIRNRGDVTPAMRIVWTPFGNSTSKTLEIHGVQPHADRAYLQLTCSEVI